MQRQDLHIISRHSNLSAAALNEALTEHLYPDKKQWQKLLLLLFLSLGVGFSLSGIVFFFAYNWANLDKFVKFGLVEGLLLLTVMLALLPKLNPTLKNTFLLGAAVSVGVLLAVFGQIYQTGADAYELFLAWTAFITFWVLVSNFLPLWLFYLLLINMTLILYTQQSTLNWSPVLISALLFCLNTGILVSAICFGKKRIASWFLYTLALGAIFYSTLGMVIFIADKTQEMDILIVFMTALIYPLGIWHGLKSKNTFYLGIIAFSLILILAAWLASLAEDPAVLPVISIFLILGITFTIKGLMGLQKKWAE